MNSRWLVLGGAAAAVGLAVCFSAGAPGQTRPAASAPKPLRYKFTISKETTYVLGPVSQDGTINYLAAFNEILGKDLKPEDNAAILMIRALGPECLEANTRAKVLAALGMGDLPAKGDYFVSHYQYAEKCCTDLTAEKRAEFANRLDGEANEIGMHGGPPWRPIPSKDLPVLAEWLKANAKPLELVAQAGRRPRFFVPWVSNADPPEMMDDLMRFSLASQRGLARTLVARAMLRAGDGDLDGASDDLVTLHGLARVLPTSTLIEYLVAISIDRLASDGDLALTRAANALPAGAARKHLAALESLRPLPDVSVVYDTGERLFGLDWMMMIAREGLNDLYARTERDFAAMLDPNEAGDIRVPDVDLDFDCLLKEMRLITDRFLICTRLPTFSRRAEAFTALDEDMLDEVKEVNKANPGWLVTRKRLRAVIEKVGTRDKRKLTKAVLQVMCSSELFSSGKPSELGDQTRAMCELGKAALALAAYRAEKGDFPDKLDALVPAFVKAVPADVFVDKPVLYKREGKAAVVYSVGPNMKDDGGKKEDPVLEPGAFYPTATQAAKVPDDIAVKVE